MLLGTVVREVVVRVAFLLDERKAICYDMIEVICHDDELSTGCNNAAMQQRSGPAIR